MSKTILVVEDDEMNMRLLHDIVECLGHTCVSAHDGFTALNLVKKREIDLILMDMQIPGISGMDVTRRLKRDRLLAHIPVIAVTACAMAGDKDRIMASGCDAYVAKPFSMLEFMGLIRTMLDPRPPATSSPWRARVTRGTGWRDRRRFDRHAER